MEIAVTIGDLLAVGTIVIGAVGVTLKFNGAIKKVEDDAGAKRARIYERLDEVKKDNDGRFVSKDVCDVKTEKLNNIEQKVDKLLTKNGIK